MVTDVYDVISLSRQWVTKTYASAYLTTVPGPEVPGQALLGSDWDQYSGCNPDINPDQYSGREPDYGPLSVLGSIALAGPDLNGVDPPQHLKTAPPIVELIQTCVIRQCQLAGSCARPEPSLAAENFLANRPGADCRADTQLLIHPNLNQEQINVRAS